VDLASLRPADLDLLAAIESGFDSVGALYDGVKLRAALDKTMKLATSVNQYLDTMAPWKQVKEDKAEAGKTIYTALKAIDSLKVLFAPILPFTSEKLHGFFGYGTPLFGEQYVEEISDSLGTHTGLRYRVGRDIISSYWKPSELKPGSEFNKPEPLFKKLDGSVIEDERARLGN
jgi:methionyl-tRNA synthetase